MIRILTVDDSAVMAGLLKALLSQEADFEVIGHAHDGREAVRLNASLRPDLITMDIRMPVMDGFAATRDIMAQRPVPIVVVSASVNDRELQITFRAIEAGALAVLEKPRAASGPAFEFSRRELIDTVRAMAEVKVVRHRPRAERARPAALAMPKRVSWELLALGCSTGGPQALREILSRLDAGFPLPIVIAQHIADGFVGGLATWLDQHSALHVGLAQAGGPLLAGHVYLAPDDHHLQVGRLGERLVARLTRGPPVNGFRPSATPLLESVAATCPGTAIGGLLTGMGSDGCDGLLSMRRARCRTFAQDRDSAVVYGMPQSALDLDAVDHVIELARIAEHIGTILRQ